MVAYNFDTHAITLYVHCHCLDLLSDQWDIICEGFTLFLLTADHAGTGRYSKMHIRLRLSTSSRTGLALVKHLTLYQT